MDDRLICTYALAKSLHEEDRDILDVFVPFILMVFYHLKESSLEESIIKNHLKKIFYLEIPGYTLKTIITRGKRTGYFTQDYNKIYLTDKGIESKKYFELKRDIERENNHLIKELTEYLNSNGLSINKDKASKILISVINSNLLSLTSYLGEEPNVTVYENIEKKAKRHTLEFFDEIEKTNPSLFSILKKMIMGSIICVLVKKDQNELKTKMNSTKIFLDSNITFSILGYHHKKTSILAQELHKLLLENNFEIYIFDFTLKEIRRVLSTYKDNYKNYNSKFKTHSIYNRLKAMGITKQRMTEILANLEEKLYDNYNINIYKTNNLLNQFEVDNNLISKLRKYKNNSPTISITHDLKAIEAIKRIRNSKYSKLEKTNSLFLTSDQKLTKFNFEQDHKDDSTINEVIIDRMLTNVLWFKNPTRNSNLPLFSVISMHSSSLFIDEEVWDKFSSVLENMKENNKIKEFDITVMLFNDKFEEKLLDIEGDLNKIDENFIENLLKESKNFYLEKEKDIKKHKKEKKKILNEHIDYIKNIKNNIVEDANIKSRRWYIGSIAVVVVLLLLSAIWIWKQPWSGLVTNLIIPFISLIISGIEFKFNFIFQKIKDNRYNYYLEKLNTKYSGFDSFEELEEKIESFETEKTKKIN